MSKINSPTYKEERPWGWFEILSDTPDYKVKRIIIHSGKRLSLQRHRYRNEHWYILSGEALITMDNREIELHRGESIDIACDTLHRIANNGNEDLIVVEIQTGSYFGEDDIERIADDFGRI